MEDFVIIIMSMLLVVVFVLVVGIFLAGAFWAWHRHTKKQLKETNAMMDMNEQTHAHTQAIQQMQSMHNAMEVRMLSFDGCA